MLGTAALAVLPPGLTRAVKALSGHRTELWFSKPANRWMEALPIGNGRIGGMVFGGTSIERIALTESTLWSGAPSDKDIDPTAFENLGRIRDLMFAGKYVEGGQLCKEHLLGRPESFGTNLPMADLELAFDGSGAAQDYRRSLDLDEAIAHVDYTRDGLRFHREIFSSNPDDVLVVHLTCSHAKSLSCGIAFGKVTVPGEVTREGNDTLVLRGHAFEHKHSNGRQGVAFETRVRVITDGELVANDGTGLRVSNADALTLQVAISTNYRGEDASIHCARALEALRQRTFAQLRSAHIEDHQSLFRRVSIDLGANPSAEQIPTDERRKAVQAGEADPGLSALFFQFGRYLTIAGSRSNSPLPLALQGIWNDGLASSMGWTDDFHLDINTEQNYWLAEVGNLPESQTPLFALIEELRTSGRTTAKTLYNAPGWVSHVVTNPWGYTAPGWGLGWGIFVTAGVWISLQMWEHFRFTGDVNFLRERVYPVFKEAAEFFLAYMVEHPKHGWLVTGPSDSPENAFRTPSGAVCNESMGPTCDRVLVAALFNKCLEAQALLSIDSTLGSAIEQARRKLPPFQIGRYGQLQEWLEDFEEAEPNHRHTSHLIALYPEDQISPEKTPQLAKAARVTLERRIQQPNWEDTEWSRANLVNYYARLWDGEAAHRHLVGLIAKATDDNLLTYSRGGVAGASQNIFAIDGNTAGAAGLAEMLLQSQGDAIHLLPALPVAWPRGSVSGLCARGGFQVEMRWRSHKLVSAAISSTQSASCHVRYGKNILPVRIEAGRKTRLTERSFLLKRT